MKYISQINGFWNWRMLNCVSHAEADLYFATVSVYDLIQTHEAGLPVSQGMWDEKIGDSINYLLLLTALIEDERMSQTCGEACADKED